MLHQYLFSKRGVWVSVLKTMRANSSSYMTRTNHACRLYHKSCGKGLHKQLKSKVKEMQGKLKMLLRWDIIWPTAGKGNQNRPTDSLDPRIWVYKLLQILVQQRIFNSCIIRVTLQHIHSFIQFHKIMYIGFLCAHYVERLRMVTIHGKLGHPV